MEMTKSKKKKMMIRRAAQQGRELGVSYLYPARRILVLSGPLLVSRRRMDERRADLRCLSG